MFGFSIFRRENLIILLKKVSLYDWKVPLSTGMFFFLCLKPFCLLSKPLLKQKFVFGEQKILFLGQKFVLREDKLPLLGEKFVSWREIFSFLKQNFVLLGDWLPLPVEKNVLRREIFSFLE